MHKEVLHVITNSDKLELPSRGLFVEAHRDDTALGPNTDGLTIVTLTDGAARKKQHITPSQMKQMRQNEGIVAAKVEKAADIYFGDFPDGELEQHIDHASTILSRVVEESNARYLIAPSPFDPHSDHRAAAIIAKNAAKEKLPLYYGDTIYEQGIQPSHYIPLSRRQNRQRRRAYFTNESQVTDLPYGEMTDVHAVLRMTHRRGKEVGVPYAMAITQDEQTRHLGDPIAEGFGERVIVRK